MTSRRPSWLPAKRQEFPVAVRKTIALRSAGMCEGHLLPKQLYAMPAECNRPARDFDHITPDALGGAATVENGAHLSAHCHALKTDVDKAMIAKADRRGVRSGQQARRGRAKAAGKHKSIPARGFNKGLRKKMNGTVEVRNR